MSSDLPLQVSTGMEVGPPASAPPPAWSPPPEDALPEPGAPPIARLVGAILRYKWWILGLTAVGSIGGIVASQFVHPQYTADATVWIDVPDRQADTQGPLQPSELLDASAWVDLLRSYTVLDYVVQERRLYLDYSPDAAPVMAGFALASRFRPGTYVLQAASSGRRFELLDHGKLVDQGAIGDSVGRAIGFLWRPGAQALRSAGKVEFTVTTPREASRTLNRDFQARLPERGNFLRLSYTDRSPTRVASVVNSVADRYIAVAADLKAGKTREVARILGEQLAQAEQNLRTTESQLEGFRVRTITMPSERATPVAPGLQMTQNPVMSRYFDMKVQRETLDRDRDAIQQALAGGSISVDALMSVESVQRSAELKQALDELTAKRAAMRAMQQKYTGEYPPLQKAAADVETLEQQTVPRLAHSIMASLQTRERELDRLIDAASQQLESIPPRAVDEGRLQRRVSVAEDVYNTLRRRYEEARLAAQTSIPDVRILDRATVPQDPSRDPRWMAILIGILGSLGLGLAGAVLMDRFDPRVRYPEQITHRLGLPILGVVPGVHMRNGVLGEGDVAQVVEALRGIRLSLAHAYGAAGPLVVTVSSPGSGDGKSFVVSNLAIAFAELGHRTIVVDGDIRRGVLHRMLGGARKPGLTDYLAGRVNREAIVQHTQQRSLDLIGSGTRLHNGPELLSSPATAELFGQLRKSYEVVLVDSPPLGAGVDPFVWSVLTGNLLLVVRAGRTERAMAEAKLEALDRMPVRVLGAIMNGAERTGIYRYYSYQSGYEMHDETPEELPRLQPAGLSDVGR